LAFRILCASRGEFKFLLENILKDGGEGAIVRKPASTYEHGRSLSLVKIKVGEEGGEKIGRGGKKVRGRGRRGDEKREENLLLLKELAV
jgi:ATP-dependent DNA ligase